MTTAARERLQALRAAHQTRKNEKGFDRYRDDPVGFITDVLEVQLWSRQQDIARAAARSKRVAVRSGHKVGKSTLLVSLALWWVCTRVDGRVVMTSASGRQVRSILWRELRKIYRRVKKKIGGILHKVPEAGLQFDDGREIVGFSTKEPEKAAGVSGAELLYLIDEASGVPEEIFEAIEGNRAGGASLLMFSNPTRTEGYFYEAFHAKREYWTTFHISSEETPNCISGETVIPGLAGREWVEEKRGEWGEESLLFQVRVRGNFPTQADNSVIGLWLVEAAIERWSDLEEDKGLLEIGVDPARFGSDESSIVPRRGSKIVRIDTHQNLDGPDLAGKVLTTVRELRRPSEIPRVKIDVNGIGASCYDALARSDEVEAIPVNSSQSPSDRELFAKLRDQLWFGFRDWLKEGGAIPDDPKLAAELVTPTYSFDAQNRQKVESKDEIKKRLKRSPDRADGAILSVFNPPSRGHVEDTPEVEDDGRWSGTAGRGW